MFWLGLLLIGLLIADTWAIAQVSRSAATRIAKAGWTIAIVISPLPSLIAWIMAGPREHT